MTLTSDQIRTAWVSAIFEDRIALLREPDFPVDILIEVAVEDILYLVGRREKLKVKQAAYQHPNLPVYIMAEQFQRLAEKQYTQVTPELGFLFNPNFPFELLDPSSRKYVGHSSETTDRILRTMLAHPDCPTGIFQVASKSYNIDVRLALASSHALPASFFATVLKDNSRRVQLLAIANHTIPLETISQIFLRDGFIKKEVNAQILRGVVRRLPLGEAHREAIARLSTCHDQHSRTLVAQYTESPAEADELCFDPHPQVRQKASENPRSSDEARVAAILINGTFSIQA